MIPLLILLPAIVAAILLRFQSPSTILVRLYVPCLLLVPLYLRFGLAGLLFDVTVGMSVVLGAAAFLRWRHTLRLSLLDCCVLADCLTVFLADAQHGNLRIGFYSCAQELCGCGLPYLLGRTLIEQSGFRTRFAKAVVLCLALVAVLSVYEYIAISNPFQTGVEGLLKESSGWHRQVRWGFSRVAGPYGHAIFAGMIFSIGLMFQLWLASAAKWKYFPGRRSIVVTLLVLGGLFMTQSRGPWIGCILGLIAASAGFFRNRRRAATIAIATLSLALIVTGVFLNGYTQTTSTGAYDEDQQNAAYRRKLWDTYLPLVARGGLLGLGSGHKLADGSIGWSDKQPSIDNEYLLRAVSVGYLGCTLLVALFTVAILHLIGLCRTFRARDDVVLAYCLLGIAVGAAFTLTTVALSQPVVHLLFLTLGWSQSLRPTVRRPGPEPTLAQKPFVFERVFV